VSPNSPQIPKRSSSKSPKASKDDMPAKAKQLLLQYLDRAVEELEFEVSSLSLANAFLSPRFGLLLAVCARPNHAQSRVLGISGSTFDVSCFDFLYFDFTTRLVQQEEDQQNGIPPSLLRLDQLAGAAARSRAAFLRSPSKSPSKSPTKSPLVSNSGPQRSPSRSITGKTQADARKKRVAAWGSSALFEKTKEFEKAEAEKQHLRQKVETMCRPNFRFLSLILGYTCNGHVCLLFFELPALTCSLLRTDRFPPW
jgi:hypothetical protein